MQKIQGKLKHIEIRLYNTEYNDMMEKGGENIEKNLFSLQARYLSLSLSLFQAKNVSILFSPEFEIFFSSHALNNVGYINMTFQIPNVLLQGTNIFK